MNDDGFAKGYKEISECRICKGTRLQQYVNLEYMPLVNHYVKPDYQSQKDEVYPLRVNYCLDCSLSQLSIVLDPAKLFTYYAYRSSISGEFSKHCQLLAENAKKRFDLRSNELALDIGSNDGSMLYQFKQLGIQVLGIEPAKNLAQLAVQRSIPTIAEFWNVKTANHLRSKNKAAKLITAMNVFAHVHDLDEFLMGINIALDDEGIFILEFPWLLKLIEQVEFDTIYHEHLSYFLLKPLIHLFNRHSLTVIDVEVYAIHGGSLRLYLKKQTSTKWESHTRNIDSILKMEEEAGLYHWDAYANFFQKIVTIRNNLCDLIHHLKSQGKKIVTYGASAKGCILTNFCNFGREDINYIIDDTPEKKNYLSPGTHLPIVSVESLLQDKPDYILILAWNFSSEIIKKVRDLNIYSGSYIIPIPEIQIV
jgi:SAM-dependent methyltransferase